MFFGVMFLVFFEMWIFVFISIVCSFDDIGWVDRDKKVRGLKVFLL